MNRLKRFIWVFITLCSLQVAVAQHHNQIRIAHNRLVLELDMRSNKAEIDSLLKAAGAKNLTANMILSGKVTPSNTKGWKINKLKKFTIQLERPLYKSDTQLQVNPYVITSSIINNISAPGYPGEVLYGINNFLKATIHELPSGLTRFFLPGYTNARRVQVSGNFNSWTTLKGLMTRTDSGWITDIRLEPGVYAYKYIINGHWIKDASNSLTEPDGYGEYNSIYYRYNYTFKLAGYNNASRISVAGNFNKWNANELVMMHKGNAWEKQLYLHEGVYLYRFMVNGQWIKDPANKDTQIQNNTLTSVLKLGESLVFRLNAYPEARNVFLAGDFNNWNPSMLKLQKTALGWLLPYTLPAGNYNYKFIVDGRWITDPQNPHTSILNDNQNSFLTVRPNHTFVLKGYASAKMVRLAGDFNDWNPQGYTLEHAGNEWHISMRLRPGKYRYKFIVDGQWILDPGNRQWEQNEYNNGNSVLWIEQ
ncbi:hypothetical protein HH214_18055 [Mucilaginibacter robiniae]|uniref:AMP-activated protein kinase glycogen-binding domain-containing protein n=1 Tax=Mucilaginibacter robiniae TaxID=2728022 RepID=A0A7L5E3E6_9SPHI|nr:hypothetical protein [Mucilaginibacter robiniae]QJD97645.1 hypothetical protein HH214_18055 [Mucilaginibacter robiniae]